MHYLTAKYYRMNTIDNLKNSISSSVCDEYLFFLVETNVIEALDEIEKKIEYDYGELEIHFDVKNKENGVYLPFIYCTNMDWWCDLSIFNSDYKMNDNEKVIFDVVNDYLDDFEECVVKSEVHTTFDYDGDVEYKGKKLDLEISLNRAEIKLRDNILSDVFNS